MYPVRARDFPSPERGILGILIGELTLKSAFSLLTILSFRKRYTENCWFFYSEK